MWIWRREFIALKVHEAELERDLRDTKNRIVVLEATNLQLQDTVQTLKQRQSFGPKDDDLFGGDPLAEDPDEIARVVREIQKEGRDIVIAREAQNV